LACAKYYFYVITSCFLHTNMLSAEGVPPINRQKEWKIMIMNQISLVFKLWLTALLTWTKMAAESEGHFKNKNQRTFWECWIG